MAARRRTANAPLVAAVVTALLCAFLYAAHRGGLLTLPYLETAELGTLDARFKLRGPRAPKDDGIVIVALDEETRARAPEIYQKRSGWARLVAAIARYEPAAIGIDGYFASPELVLPPTVVGKVRAADEALAAEPATTSSTLAREALGAVLEETRGDERLAEAVAAARVVVLGALLFVDEEPAAAGTVEPSGLAGARAAEVVVAETHPSRRPPQAGARVVAPLPAIAAGARGAGLLNVIHDEDGAVRRAYGLVERGGRFYLPLALATARARTTGGGDVAYVTGEETLAFGGHALAVDARGRAQLDFLGPAGTFRHIAAIDVLSGRTPREAIAGKLVFVGYTDAARDKLITPFDPLLAGVELHATFAHNALFGELLRRAGPRGTLAAILGLGFLLALLQLRAIRARRPWIVGLAAVALIAGYLAVAQRLFAAGIIVDVAAPLLSFVLITVAALATALVTEGREKARIRAAFSQYLDDNAVKEILADPSRLELGGERRELTVLFSDIRGFTQLSEDLEPEQVIGFLNAYLTPMTEVVWTEGGMLDKYIGDAVMAVFGAPLAHQDHAARACRSAVAMQRRLGELNDGWAKNGLPRIAVGIGLNTGPMSVGNMGSVRRKNYTVIGDAVNLGSRLEALTKSYDVDILVGERTRALAGDGFQFRELDLVRVRGKDRPERVYELVVDEKVDAAGYAIALGCCRRKEWDEAERGFARLVEMYPWDGPAAVMLARVRRLRKETLPANWDGVYDA
jgi:adenylate cyclase